MEEVGEIDWSVQIFIYEKNKVWGCMYKLIATVGSTMFITETCWIHLKNSKNKLLMWDDECVN